MIKKTVYVKNNSVWKTNLSNQWNLKAFVKCKSRCYLQICFTHEKKNFSKYIYSTNILSLYLKFYREIQNIYRP